MLLTVDLPMPVQHVRRLERGLKDPLGWVHRHYLPMALTYASRQPQKQGQLGIRHAVSLHFKGLSLKLL